MEAIGSVLAMPLVERLCVPLGRVALFALTLGRWRGENLALAEGGIHAPAGALSFERDGQRVLTRTGLAIVGGCVLLLLVLLGALAATRLH